MKEILKKANSKISFAGTSDTEVLLAYIEMFGVKQALIDIKGMFAFALWDNHAEELILARDIAGEKPLYYGCINGTLYFASEPKAIKNKIKNLKISHRAVKLMLKYNCIPAPYSIYEDIYKVEPSTYLRFKNPTCLPIKEKYFSPKLSPINDSNKNYLNEFENLLDNSVKTQMISDVPIGSFLSGGIDSSLITYFMQQNSNKPINTFSIGFNDETYNEAPYSKKIAKAIGTNHHEL